MFPPNYTLKLAHSFYEVLTRFYREQPFVYSLLIVIKVTKCRFFYQKLAYVQEKYYLCAKLQLNNRINKQ